MDQRKPIRGKSKSEILKEYNDETAKKEIRTVCVYLKHRQVLLADKKPLIDSDVLAREFCDLLLEAGDADGAGGCPLCQS